MKTTIFDPSSKMVIVNKRAAGVRIIKTNEQSLEHAVLHAMYRLGEDGDQRLVELLTRFISANAFHKLVIAVWSDVRRDLSRVNKVNGPLMWEELRTVLSALKFSNDERKAIEYVIQWFFVSADRLSTELQTAEARRELDLFPTFAQLKADMRYIRLLRALGNIQFDVGPKTTVFDFAENATKVLRRICDAQYDAELVVHSGAIALRAIFDWHSRIGKDIAMTTTSLFARAKDILSFFFFISEEMETGSGAPAINYEAFTLSQALKVFFEYFEEGGEIGSLAAYELQPVSKVAAMFTIERYYNEKHHRLDTMIILRSVRTSTRFYTGVLRASEFVPGYAYGRRDPDPSGILDQMATALHPAIWDVIIGSAAATAARMDTVSDVTQVLMSQELSPWTVSVLACSRASAIDVESDGERLKFLFRGPRDVRAGLQQLTPFVKSGVISSIDGDLFSSTDPSTYLQFAEGSTPTTYFPLGTQTAEAVAESHLVRKTDILGKNFATKLNVTNNFVGKNLPRTYSVSFPDLFKFGSKVDTTYFLKNIVLQSFIRERLEVLKTLLNGKLGDAGRKVLVEGLFERIRVFGSNEMHRYLLWNLRDAAGVPMQGENPTDDNTNAAISKIDFTFIVFQFYADMDAEMIENFTAIIQPLTEERRKLIELLALKDLREAL